ncbi:MAG: outer membrane protein assembly factor [Alphaproteobacteria bacterium]|nr:outer membrane protein assembly factor [Alphaproteobacteria bacterium]
MRFLAVPLLMVPLLMVSWIAPPAYANTPPTDFSYIVRFEGLDQTTAVAEAITDSSTLVAQARTPPPTRAALRRRANQDIERMIAAARSFGYYDAAVDVAIEPPVDSGPSTVVVTATTGQVYAVADVAVHAMTGDSSAVGLELPRADIPLKPGDPAVAAPVLDAETVLVRLVRERGYPLAKAGERKVVIDRAAKTMMVTYTIDSGPRARFGPVRVVGSETVDPTYILRRLPWRYGQDADVRQLEKGRRALTATGVFDTVTVTFDDAVDGDGLLPVQVTVVERDRRTIGAGVSASTSEGLGATAFWTHRNLFGGAERFDFRADLAEVKSGVSGQLRLPDIIRNDQDLVLHSGYVEKNTDSFDSETYSVGGYFDWRLSRILSVDYGAVLERSEVDEDGVSSQFTLVGIPLGVTLDTADDLLNPTKGGRTRLRFTPYLETLGSTQAMYQLSVQHAHYLALDSAGDMVLAGRARWGAIIGSSTTNLPADKRFYSGGSGSVRGYAFQHVGPLDAGNEPLGGRSVIEVSAELRWRVWGDVGIVPFIDAGQVYNTETPSLDEELQWGAGLGVRYFTPVGPVRADLGFPLNGRDSDDTFQVYFSLGQAF